MTPVRIAWIVPLFTCLLIGLGGCGSSGPIVGGDVEKRIYLVEGQDVDESPEIEGGYERIDELKTYPTPAAEEDAYGVIWIQTTISASGSASRTRLAQGGHPALETEALNVVQNLDFRPARKDGVPIQSRVQIPVIFEGPYRTPEEDDEEG